MSTVNNVKMSFESVLSIRDDIICVFGILDNKIHTLKELYESIVKSHNNHENTFGIDSFYFQNQLIETDYNHLQSIFIDIDAILFTDKDSDILSIRDEILADLNKITYLLSLQ